MTTSTWTGAVSSDWDGPDNWSPAGVPDADTDVTIATGEAVASASIGTVNSISNSASLRFRSAETKSVATFVDNSDDLRVDRQGGAGGTILNIAGALTNSGSLHIGNAKLSASDAVTAATLDNTGKIYLSGSAADQALLEVSGAAGFGASGILSGYVRLSGDSAIEFASGETTSLAAHAQLHLNGPDAFVEDKTAPGSNSALARLAKIGAGAVFGLHNRAAASTGALVNDGYIYLDFDSGDGGSNLTVGGTLSNSGSLSIGNAELSASDVLTTASLDNTGSISLTGSSADQALLDVTTGVAGFGASGVLSGDVTLMGDSAIEFTSGEISTIGTGATLSLFGNDAFLEDSAALGSNSALTGLSTLSGVLLLDNGASLSTTGALVNQEVVELDFDSGDGRSSLTVAGTLTNNRLIAVGNAKLSASDEVTAAALDNTTSAAMIDLTGSSVNQALLDVAGSAGFGTEGVLSSNVELSQDSAIEFASGQITSLASNAQLQLDGNDAFIEDSAALGSNSALTGLASIGDGAVFGLQNKAAVSATGALDNDGYIYLDFDSGDGGSNLTIGGTLSNSGSLSIGNAKLSASDILTTASLDNTGSISLTGSSVDHALLKVTTGVAGFGAAGILSGDVTLMRDSAIEFASGQITSLAANAQLQLNGNDTFIEDSSTQGSNSALSGLASIGADASFELANGASVSTTGALVNNGFLGLDYSNNSEIIDQGGSSLTVGGTLTNTGMFEVAASYYGLKASDTVTVAALDNTDAGWIYLGGFYGHPALLDVTTGGASFGAAGTLTGGVEIYDAAIEFVGGQINTIATDGSLTIEGNDAFMEDSTALGSNSALAALSEISGYLGIQDGGAVSTNGGLVNDGVVDLGVYNGSSLAALNIGGALTNTRTLEIGVGGYTTSASVTATSFINSGQVELYGDVTNALDVSGATTNNGSISITQETQGFGGLIRGTGSFNLSSANLQFDSSVSTGQSINEDPSEVYGPDALILEQAQSFAATVSGFGAGDTIDAANFLLSGTTFNFVENSAGTGGTLTLQDGSLTAHIHMTGDYSKSSFTLAPDSGTGTLVKFV